MVGSNLHIFRWTWSSVDWTEQEAIPEISLQVDGMELGTDFVSSTRLLVKASSGSKIYDTTGNGAHAFDINLFQDIFGALSGDGRFLVTANDTEPTIVLFDLRNNITSEMDVPGMTWEDRIIAVGFDAMVQAYDDVGGAEYSELGLSVVVHTGLDENGTDLVAICYFAVDVGFNGTTLSMKAAVETKMKGSLVVFSSDGSSLLLKGDGISWRPFFLNNAKTRWLQATDIGFSGPSPDEISGPPLLPSISSGNGRIRVVDKSVGTLQVMEAAATCLSLYRA